MITLAITPGDPEGIGPEIVWKTIRSGFFKKRKVRLICVGAKEPFALLRAKFHPIPEASPMGELPIGFVPLLFPPAAPTPCGSTPGFQSGWSIKKATELVLAGKADALVTGPIHKERLQAGGFSFPGHTEYLAHLCGTKSVTMMLANSTLRVSLVTTHLGIHALSKTLTTDQIVRATQQTYDYLRTFLKIQSPRIAVTALNPHAGEGGLFGREEIDVIQPAIAALRGKGLRVEGPFPADTFFAKHVMTPPKERFDAVVAMYHDQGLIPVKLLDFKRTVNITLGLPIIRTSVDHGVGFDIAGKGIADPSSFQAAVDLAIRLAQNKRKGTSR